MSRDLDLLKLAKDRWVSANEAANAIDADHVGYVRHRLRDLVLKGFLKQRQRERRRLPSGRKESGPSTAEFRVRTEWGGLES